MKTILSRLHKCVFSPKNVSFQAAGELLGLDGECETVFFVLVVEIARLTGRMKKLEKSGGCCTFATCLGGAPPTTSAPLPVVEAARTVVPPKPMVTRSIVACSKSTRDTPKEVVKKDVVHVGAQDQYYFETL